MIKTYNVTAELNMCAEKVVTMTVKANTERKARKFAEEKLKKEGYFHIIIFSCKEIKPNKGSETK